MNSMPDRLKRARAEIGCSVEELSRSLSENNIRISARTIYSYELGERQPSTMYLEALVRFYEINPFWLLGNSNEIFCTDSQHQVTYTDVDMSNLIFLPLISMSPSAGAGSLIREKEMTKDFVAFAKKWLTNITVTSPNNLVLFTVKGDSMEGEISDGDLIMVNETMTDLSSEGTYVVSIDDKLYVKILQRIPGNKVQVISKNTKYAPFTIDLNTEYFKIIGKVIWSGGKSDVN